MPNTIEAVDNYIAKAPEFAKPILLHLRALVHQSCPDIQENIKWGCPSFEYKGIVGGMAFFKKHVDFRFDKGDLLDDPQGLFSAEGNNCVSAIQPKSLAELPSDEVFVDYLKRAVALNQQGIKKAPKKIAVTVPEDFLNALSDNPQAQKVFNDFAPGYQRDYIEWFDEAKRAATRENRIVQAIEWIAEGKTRNWKYQKK